MIEFFSYVFDLVRRLLSLWSDERLSPFFGGVNFLYIILSVWVFWIMINLFLIRPIVGGSLFDVARSAKAGASKIGELDRSDGD